MTRELRFIVVGVPIPQGSLKSYVVKRKSDGHAVAVTTSDNPKTKGWRQSIADVAARELRAAQNIGIYFTGAVEFDVTFYLPRPQRLMTLKAAGRHDAHLTRPDVGKLLRAAEDALSQVVWTDDAQITDLHGRKRYCAIGDHPRAEILVREARPEPPPELEPLAAPLFEG